MGFREKYTISGHTPARDQLRTSRFTGDAAAVTSEDIHKLELEAAAETAKTEQDRKIRRLISNHRNQKAINIDSLSINDLNAASTFLKSTKTDKLLVNLIDTEIDKRQDETFLKMLDIFRKYLQQNKQALILQSINKYTKLQLSRLITLEQQKTEKNLVLIEHLQTALMSKGGRKSNRRRRRTRKTRFQR